MLRALGAVTAVAATAGISLIRRPAPAPVATTLQVNQPSTTAATVPTTVTVASFPPTTAPSTTVVPAVRLDVICRAAWGAREPSPGMQSHTIDRMTLHHTAVRLDDNRESPNRIRGHQSFHQSEGFSDLAYHFLVDRSGNVFEGRPWQYAGETFTEYDPDGHFLVCCEGDYGSQKPGAQQLKSVSSLFAWAAREFGIDPSEIGGHRDYAATSCPGDHLYERLSEIRSEAALLARTGIELASLCGDQGTTVVSAIESGEA